MRPMRPARTADAGDGTMVETAAPVTVAVMADAFAASWAAGRAGGGAGVVVVVVVVVVALVIIIGSVVVVDVVVGFSLPAIFVVVSTDFEVVVVDGGGFVEVSFVDGDVVDSTDKVEVSTIVVSLVI